MKGLLFSGIPQCRKREFVNILRQFSCNAKIGQDIYLRLSDGWEDKRTVVNDVDVDLLNVMLNKLGTYVTVIPPKGVADQGPVDTTKEFIEHVQNRQNVLLRHGITEHETSIGAEPTSDVPKAVVHLCPVPARLSSVSGNEETR